MTRRLVLRHQRFDRVGRDRDFCFWHLCDMPTGPDDVRFQGKTGSSWPTTEMTRLTHLGHLWTTHCETGLVLSRGSSRST